MPAAVLRENTIRFEAENRVLVMSGLAATLKVGLGRRPFPKVRGIFLEDRKADRNGQAPFRINRSNHVTHVLTRIIDHILGNGTARLAQLERKPVRLAVTE